MNPPSVLLIFYIPLTSPCQDKIKPQCRETAETECHASVNSPPVQVPPCLGGLAQAGEGV